MTARPFTALVRGFILAYRYSLSGLLGGSCRYWPTCSAYALEAVDRYGGITGGRLAAGRLLRCHPWGGAGADPVPDLPGFSAPACCDADPVPGPHAALRRDR